MHAGGVAESSGPWNDEKDPFEVFRDFSIDYFNRGNKILKNYVMLD